MTSKPKTIPLLSKTTRPGATTATTTTKEPISKTQLNKKPMTTSNKSLNKISNSAPVVKMTKSAQLRAQLASSNSNNNNNSSCLNSTITTSNPVKQFNKPKPTAYSSRPVRPSIKDPISTKETANSVHVNPHLDHLNRNGPRRKSFTGIVKKKLVSDPSNPSNTSISGTTSKMGTASKPKLTLWK